MKKRLLALLLAYAAATQAATLAPAAPPMLSPQQAQAQAANLTAQILTRYHYKATPLDDALSEKIFERYLKSLDPEKMFFLQSDVDQFAHLRTKLDDAIFREDLRIPFDIFNLYEQRVVERLAHARELLKQGFDFSQNESYQYEREKAAWPKSDEEVKDLWRKRVKNDWLRLKLAGKDEKFIRETLDKRYNTSLSRAYKYKSEDVFQVFMNAYTNAIEPHTDYFTPKSTEDFDIAMKLSLVGIGAVLQERDEYTTIRELVPGGPAAASGKLAVGDRIVAVGQGKDAAMTDVVGWRIDDVVKLIRGNKGTVVRLDILPAEAGPDAKHKIIELVRDKISLEKQAAKKSVIQLKDKEGGARKVGVITLPSFYQDFDGRRKGEKDFRSASRDVARLLDELKKEKVDSVLIDLRNNGGGALDEAIELTSLFIGKGPVVMERTSQGNIKVENVGAGKRAWEGPLGVLINRGSASASEIFAAAVQDYGRGIVIGEPSFGKGTVQTLVNLDRMVHNDKPKFGELKMTIAQFFRVNGGTTQLRGVTPDIGFPNMSDLDAFGEASYDNALPWAQIKAADYAPIGETASLMSQLKERHAARVAKDKDFQYLLEDIAEFNALRKKQSISLNEAERRKERDRQEARLKLRTEGKQLADGKGKKPAKGEAGKKTAARDGDTSSVDDFLDDLHAGDESVAGKTKKEPKDVWLSEAAHILGDQLELLKANTKLAARTMPAAVPTAKGKSD
ncbi:MAG TPA: carboxy terminal-processing peptidase [Paucimonas sp.]|nr:carboxy terminal-processing peptidase [Paucimonas sp.]